MCLFVYLLFVICLLVYLLFVYLFNCLFVICLPSLGNTRALAKVGDNLAFQWRAPYLLFVYVLFVYLSICYLLFVLLFICEHLALSAEEKGHAHTT